MLVGTLAGAEIREGRDEDDEHRDSHEHLRSTPLHPRPSGKGKVDSYLKYLQLTELETA